MRSRSPQASARPTRKRTVSLVIRPTNPPTWPIAPLPTAPVACAPLIPPSFQPTKPPTNTGWLFAELPAKAFTVPVAYEPVMFAPDSLWPTSPPA